ncbi:MAG: DSD1 family PLP-dependent enzyme [Alphaproteobacteria bacterium]
MTEQTRYDDYDVGYDIPARPGMDEAEIQTPCLVVDLDAFERNVARMRDHIETMGVRHRAHGKMHKSSAVARYQIDRGNASGICCQKVSEAEAFARGGVTDILISNQIRDPAKIDRLARLPKLGARILCCIDDIDNVAELSNAVTRHGTEIECLVEIDCGAGRCGVTSTDAAVEIAKAIDAAPGLKFGGLQAYQGNMQHLRSHAERKAAFDTVTAIVKDALAGLNDAGLPCETVTGGGTGSYRLEGESGIFNELQCGSYAFMDADYGRVKDINDTRLDASEWENALFVLTSIMSHAKPHQAVCDAGLKVLSFDSGLPVVYGRDDVEYTVCSDEHGVIENPKGVLKVNDRLKLVPGHCDPTCNLHDWYVGVRNGKVEKLWPIDARGRAY